VDGFLLSIQAQNLHLHSTKKILNTIAASAISCYPLTRSHFPFAFNLHLSLTTSPFLRNKMEAKDEVLSTSPEELQVSSVPVAAGVRSSQNNKSLFAQLRGSGASKEDNKKSPASKSPRPLMRAFLKLTNSKRIAFPTEQVALPSGDKLSVDPEPQLPSRNGQCTSNEPKSFLVRNVNFDKLQ
jgi:hypothetical protein